MEWLNKIPQWIQVPLKILLPSLTIFSGFIMFSSEELLEVLYLLKFKNENGFAFGLIFVICSSLIICYIGSFFIKKFVELWYNYILKKKQYKIFMNLDNVYKKALLEMYKSPTRSLRMGVNTSVATYLEAIHAVGRSSLSTRGIVFDFYLQPWVVKCIEKMCEAIENDINKLNKTLQDKKEELNHNKIKQEIQELEEILSYIKTQNEIETEDDFW